MSAINSLVSLGTPSSLNVPLTPGRVRAPLDRAVAVDPPATRETQGAGNIAVLNSTDPVANFVRLFLRGDSAVAPGVAQAPADPATADRLETEITRGVNPQRTIAPRENGAQPAPTPLQAQVRINTVDTEQVSLREVQRGRGFNPLGIAIALADFAATPPRLEAAVTPGQAILPVNPVAAEQPSRRETQTNTDEQASRVRELANVAREPRAGDEPALRAERIRLLLAAFFQNADQPVGQLLDVIL